MHRIRRKAPAIPSTQSLPSRILQLYFITGKANRIPVPEIDLIHALDLVILDRNFRVSPWVIQIWGLGCQTKGGM